ncbi:hypothetical protein ACF1AJ_14435 [Leifsonia sp. NPDC014704]|uniref:hypothetical protein n=1 Tax=Leifsonia sp. NPDC014704 TaxID=3364123 RepID=UPI0036F48A0A
MRHRHVATGAVALLMAGVLTGCSADDSARSSLSQSAGTAASAARAGGLVLGLHEQDLLLSTVQDTGLTDVAERLAQEAQTVSTMTAIGGIGARRDSVLADIRAAQDVVTAAQRAEASGTDSAATVDRQRRELDRLARDLQAASQRLDRG